MMSKINLALGGISFDQGSFEEGDLPVYISRVFDRFTTGGFEVQLQRVLAAGGDELDEMSSIFRPVGSLKPVQVLFPGLPTDHAIG